MPSCAICWESGGGDPILCENTPWVNKINGLYWAFASVCAGECGIISKPLPWGWRFATTDEWNAFLVEWDKTDWAEPDKCAASYFDDDWVADGLEWVRDTCSYGDHNNPWITNVENNSNYDLFLVHSDQVCP